MGKTIALDEGRVNTVLSKSRETEGYRCTTSWLSRSTSLR